MSFLITPPPFNGDRFELWKARFKILIQSFNFELQETIINGYVIPTHYITGEVVHKIGFLQTN